jgi:hypothetical protein
MALFFVGLLLGVLLGWLTLGCYLHPMLGRVCVRIFAVISLSIGLGLLIWAIVAQALHQHTRLELGTSVVVSQTSDAIALGSGYLVAGIAALVLSFVGRKKAVAPPVPDSAPPP